jgi:hypothetical protein
MYFITQPLIASDYGGAKLIKSKFSTVLGRIAPKTNQNRYMLYIKAITIKLCMFFQLVHPDVAR